MKNLIVLLFLLISVGLHSQRINTSFGKNRVQFHKDYNEWRKYQSEHFTSYWYGRAKNIANDALNMGEQEYYEIRKTMEYRLNEKIELFIYTDLTDLKQSNIGLDDIFIGKAGKTNVQGNKIFLYFDGNHNHLLKSVREGIAEVFLNQMYIGSGIKEVIKNRIMLKVPAWYQQGLISYIGSQWDSKIDNEFRTIINDNDKESWDFHNLASVYPRVIGHSFWYFIDRNYGKSAISNILYLTRIYKDTEEAFLIETGQEMEEITALWYQYYYNNYHSNKISPKELKIRNAIFNKSNIDLLYRSKYDELITNVVSSPNNENLIFCKNKQGKYKLILWNTKTKKTTTVFKFGYKNLLQETDYNYPLVTWDNNDFITVVYEKRDIIYLRKINIITLDYVEQKIPRIVQRIYSISTINDIEYVISASVDGYSNLYIYNAKKRQHKPLTSDKFDHLNASYVNIGGQEGILFKSTRFSVNDHAKVVYNNFDVCFYNMKTREISKYDFDSGSDVKNIEYIGDNQLSYLSNKSGNWLQYIYQIDKNKSFNISNNLDQIIGFNIDGKGINYKILSYENRHYLIKERLSSIPIEVITTPYILNKNNENIIVKEEVKPQIPDGYKFVTRFTTPIDYVFLSDRDRDTSKVNKYIFKSQNITGARLEFRLDDYSVDFSNDILFEGLETYISDENSVRNNDNKGILMKASVLDLFENYDIEAGLRVPTRLNGNEVYLVAKDNKSLLDKEYIIYRRSRKNTIVDPIYYNLQKTKKTNLLTMIRWKYPFDVYHSLRLSTSYRIDKFYYQGVDDRHYFDPIVNEKRVALKLEYIFDNTIQKGINVLHGTRYKLYTEAINKMDIQIFDNPTFKLNTGHSFVFGFDARNYIPLGRHAVVASRATAFTSLGSEKILYQLGGVENALNPSQNTNAPTIQGDAYAYYYNVANLRGFRNNSRNGNSAMLASLEMRISVFEYFTKRRIRSAFLRNFQLNLFYDVGTAWYGLSPFNDNPLNEIHITQPPVIKLDVSYHRDPIVMGYGLGIRTTILGIFVRADYGWGIESGIVQQPILHLAMGKDF